MVCQSRIVNCVYIINERPTFKPLKLIRSHNGTVLAGLPSMFLGAKMRSGMLSAIAGTALAFTIGLATTSQAAPILYSATGSGPFRVFPVAPTVLVEDQSIT